VLGTHNIPPLLHTMCMEENLFDLLGGIEDYQLYNVDGDVFGVFPRETKQAFSFLGMNYIVVMLDIMPEECSWYSDEYLLPKETAHKILNYDYMDYRFFFYDYDLDNGIVKEYVLTEDDEEVIRYNFDEYTEELKETFTVNAILDRMLEIGRENMTKFEIDILATTDVITG
jgi:hypothetical protein